MKLKSPGHARLAIALVASVLMAAGGGLADSPSSGPASQGSGVLEPKGSIASEKRLEERLPDGVRTTFFTDPDKLGIYRTKTVILEKNEARHVLVSVFSLQGGKWKLEQERRDPKQKLEAGEK